MLHVLSACVCSRAQRVLCCRVSILVLKWQQVGTTVFDNQGKREVLSRVSRLPGSVLCHTKRLWSALDAFHLLLLAAARKTSGIQTKKPPCRCCYLVSVRLISCLKAGSHVRHSISTRKSTCEPRRRKHKRSCACLVPVSELVLFLALIASYVWTSLNLYDAKITIQFKSVWMHYWRAQGNCSVIIIIIIITFILSR